MKRIQRQRTKGWRMPEGAVYVGRPSLWGNPWPIADVGRVYPEVPIFERAAAAVRLYQRELGHWGLMSDWGAIVSDERWDAERQRQDESGARNMGEYAAVALRGYDLVCWCPLEDDQGNRVPCHADVLLELANP